MKNKGYNPLDYRYFCLNSHYRNSLVFSYESLDIAKNAFAKLKSRISSIDKSGELDLAKKEFYVNKFKDEFLKVQKELTLKGNIVISVGLFGHSGDNEVWENMDEGTLTKTKEMLDDMHKRKIDMADEIFVINVGGYIGESTKSEIEYAKNTGKLVLENGMIFEGESIGADGTTFGEMVFNTAMEGYQEILTDPSYAGQTVVLTYPEIGNYGINKDDFESGKIHANGLIVKNFCENESHYKSYIALDEYLKQNNTMCLKGIDTRHLAQIIRDNGSMKCAITTEKITPELKQKIKEYQISKTVALDVSTYKIEHFAGSGAKVGIIDLGVTKSVAESLRALNCDITLFPADTKAEDILSEKLAAVIVSNGPGNPEDVTCTIETVKGLIGKVKLYGISLGHQIIALALGAKTYKMKYGHRGANHPVLNNKTNKIFTISQNHSYAVDETSLPQGVEVSYTNLTDNSVEGLISEKYNIETVQFYPEYSQNEASSNQILAKWVEQLENRVTV